MFAVSQLYQPHTYNRTSRAARELECHSMEARDQQSSHFPPTAVVEI